MGKDKGGFLTPKQVANRIKAKGLQKLRWFCQMCQKQCRDENGFKCHCMSESHQRQMQIFAENSTSYMDAFSTEFEEGMLEIIKRKAYSQRCSANVIYREYISFRTHFHMNATIWETLTDFVMYLGREGKCEVDETEKGWFLTYIDRDPALLAKLEARAKRERSELDSEEKHARDIERMVKAARELEPGAPEAAATELQRSAEDEKVVFGIPKAPALSKTKLMEGALPLSTNPFTAQDGGSSSSTAVLATDSTPSTAAGVSGEGGGAAGSSSRCGSCTSCGGSAGKGKAKVSAIEQLMQQEMAQKEGSSRKDYWLAEGIVIKVINKKLQGGQYHMQKGVVERLMDRYTCHVRMNASGDLIKLDQEHCETVIPAVGAKVLVVNGRHRGAQGKLLRIDEQGFCVSIKVDSGQFAGRVLDGLEYEDVCKLPSAS